MMKRNFLTKGLFSLGILMIGILLFRVPQAKAQQLSPYYNPFLIPSYFCPVPLYSPPVSPLLSYPRSAQVFATFPAPTLPIAPSATPAGLSVTALIPTTTITAVVPLTAIFAPVPVAPTYSPITLQAVVPVASATPSTINILLSLINSWLL
ncbi:MAG: hypothetical protein AB1847_11595 [bacterium]